MNAETKGNKANYVCNIGRNREAKLLIIKYKLNIGKINILVIVACYIHTNHTNNDS